MVSQGKKIGAGAFTFLAVAGTGIGKAWVDASHTFHFGEVESVAQQAGIEDGALHDLAESLRVKIDGLDLHPSIDDGRCGLALVTYSAHQREITPEVQPYVNEVAVECGTDGLAKIIEHTTSLLRQE